MMKALEVKLTKPSVEYTHPAENGRIYHLVIYQDILIPLLGHHLLNPFQTQVNDVHTHELPKFQATNPTESDHYIVVPDLKQLERQPTLHMSLGGILSYVSVSKPS